MKKTVVLVEWKNNQNDIIKMTHKKILAAFILRFTRFIKYLFEMSLNLKAHSSFL